MALDRAANHYVRFRRCRWSTLWYQVIKHSAACTGYGYTYSGIEVPVIEHRGKLVLVVDNTYAANLAPELDRLRQDMIGDGWRWFA